MHGTATITAGLSEWPYFTGAWRAVATAKIDAFGCQCERLGTLAHCGVLNRCEAADVLADIAEANSLGDVFGHEVVADMIADAFAPPAKEAEAAA